MRMAANLIRVAGLARGFSAHGKVCWMQKGISSNLVTRWQCSGQVSNVLNRRMLSSSPDPAQTTEIKLTRKEKLKLAVKDYGSTVVVFHVAISLFSLGTCYLAVSSGLDVVGVLMNVPYIGERIAQSNFGRESSTFVIAYALHKCFVPVRMSITLTATPFIVQYLRRKGILKMKPPTA